MYYYLSLSYSVKFYKSACKTLWLGRDSQLARFVLNLFPGIPNGSSFCFQLKNTLAVCVLELGISTNKRSKPSMPICLCRVYHLELPCATPRQLLALGKRTDKTSSIVILRQSWLTYVAAVQFQMILHGLVCCLNISSHNHTGTNSI